MLGRSTMKKTELEKNREIRVESSTSLPPIGMKPSTKVKKLLVDEVVAIKRTTHSDKFGTDTKEVRGEAWPLIEAAIEEEAQQFDLKEEGFFFEANSLEEYVEQRDEAFLEQKKLEETPHFYDLYDAVIRVGGSLSEELPAEDEMKEGWVVFTAHPNPEDDARKIYLGDRAEVIEKVSEEDIKNSAPSWAEYYISLAQAREMKHPRGVFGVDGYKEL